MHKSIRLKLFIAFLLTTLLVVSGMYLFMRESLNRGFAEFIEIRQTERIEQLIDRLSENYAKSNNWKQLKNNKRQWIQLLRSGSPRSRHSKRWINNAFQEPQNRWPPSLSEKQQNKHFIPLSLRIMLLNTDKSIIFGRPESLSSLILHPIYHKQQIIGYLGVLPGHPVKQHSDQRFIEQQANAFIWIALLMVTLSAGLALLLAYFFGRPLKKITAATKELAMGRYTARIPVKSSDELGQLAQNFNKMAAALEQSEQARQHWIADISHELRTPLAILRGELEALQDGIRPMTQDAINSLFSDVIRLTRLTDDLYQLTLSDQGTLTYRKTKLNPVNILQRSITGLQSKFEEKQIKVQLLDQSNNITITADADRLAQLFQNLLTNSANYTDNDGCLDIEIFTKKNILHIKFCDSAPTVPNQALNKLFDRLYRVEKSRSRNLGGSGLGLAICQNIITAHQGNISAEKSSLGGLEIHIELPLQT